MCCRCVVVERAGPKAPVGGIGGCLFHVKQVRDRWWSRWLLRYGLPVRARGAPPRRLVARRVDPRSGGREIGCRE